MTEASASVCLILATALAARESMQTLRNGLILVLTLTFRRLCKSNENPLKLREIVQT